MEEMKEFNNFLKSLLPDSIDENLNKELKKAYKKTVKQLNKDLKNNNCNNFIFFDGMTYKKHFFSKKKWYSKKQNKFVSKKEYESEAIG